MKHRTSWRPSGAMIVAMLALAMSMVGTGVAASALTKKQKKQVGNLLSSRLMAATAPAPGSCAIAQQTGGITGTAADPYCDVTFPRSVDACSVGATPVKPDGDFGGQASVRYLGGGKVRVTRTDHTGDEVGTGAFTLFAVCPS